jgi:hypothetical protein
MAESGEKSTAFNPDAPTFDITAMNAAATAAANAVSAGDTHLPDFSIEKPEVWFSMVEAFKGTALCFHHYSYGCQATRCKPPRLFQQGNRVAAGSN